MAIDVAPHPSATRPPSQRDRDQAAIDVAIVVADELLREVHAPDRRLVAIVRDRDAAEFTMALTDQVLRSPDPKTAAATFRRIVGCGTPRAFPVTDRFLLRVGAAASRIAPRFVIALVTARLRSASQGQVLPASDRGLTRRLAQSHRTGSATNINLLGEAIIGEEEAVARRDRIVEILGRSDVDAVSVKLSAIAANLSALAFDQTVERLVERVTPLYRAALARKTPALVTLDMEEFRDLELTAAVFARIVSNYEFLTLPLGIVLQAYLPDSHAVADRLAPLAIARRNAGGTAIRVRVVKGANLAMEHVEAELRGWTSAPFPNKADVDASYKRLLDRLLVPELDGAVIVGLASHNLFDIAWGMGLRSILGERGQANRLEFETLVGMADGLASAIARRGATSLVYSPVVSSEAFESAIAYLVRRLDENTSPENFLNALVDLQPESPPFRNEAAKFADAVHHRHDVDVRSRRALHVAAPPNAWFENAPDTDLAVAAFQEPLLQAVQGWKAAGEPVRPVVGGFSRSTATTVMLRDPSTTK